MEEHIIEACDEGETESSVLIDLKDLIEDHSKSMGDVLDGGVNFAAQSWLQVNYTLENRKTELKYFTVGWKNLDGSIITRKNRTPGPIYQLNDSLSLKFMEFAVADDDEEPDDGLDPRKLPFIFKIRMASRIRTVFIDMDNGFYSDLTHRSFTVPVRYSLMKPAARPNVTFS